jgi:hypothetical protein
MSNPESGMEAQAANADITTPVEVDPDLETEPIDSAEDRPKDGPTE